MPAIPTNALRRAGSRRVRGGLPPARAVALLAALVLGTPIPLAAQPGAPPMPTIDLQGHRGARGWFPENTLEGFARALAIGVTTLELDVGVTRDGVLVVSHDRRIAHEIARGAGGGWIAAPGPLIHSLDYAAVAAYDVGRIDPRSEYARRFPHQQPIDGARIPRLADLFAMVAQRGASGVRFNIETKIDPEQPADTVDATTFARALAGAIRAAGVAARATIQSFDWRTLAVVQREAPEIVTVYLTSEQPWGDTIRRKAGASPWTPDTPYSKHGSVPAMIHAAGGRVWSPYFGDLDASALAAARALGLRVVAWTVNESADIDRMLDAGVDGIISDYPDRVRDAMRRRGMTLPAQY